MAFRHGKSTRVVMHGKLMSCFLHSTTVTMEREISDAAVYCDEGVTFTPGLLNGTLSFGGRFEHDLDEYLFESLTDDNIGFFVVGPAGLDEGQTVYVAITDASSYSVESGISDTLNFTLENQADNGVYVSKSLHGSDLTTSSGEGAGVDGGQASDKGGTVTIHIPQRTSADTFDITVQHSPDNDTWADLTTFVSSAEGASQMRTLSGPIERYVRAIWTVEGTAPSTQFVVTFSRH